MSATAGAGPRAERPAAGLADGLADGLAGRPAAGLVDALDIGLCGVDDEGVIVESNHAWTAMLHEAVAIDDPIGLGFTEWAVGATPAWTSILTQLAQRVSHAAAGCREGPDLAHSVRRVDGRLREIDLGVRRLGTPTASGASVLVTAQDVTERMWVRHHSEAQLQELERLGLVGRYTDSAVAVLDQDSIIEWVSDTFVGLSGFRHEEAVGRRHWDLVRGPFLTSDAYTRFVAEAGSGRPASVEAPLHRPDGSLFWVSWNVQPMYHNGRVVKLLSVQRDITKRRRAEEMARQALIRAQRLGSQLREEKHLMTSVLATVPHGVWWKDAELTYLGCNQAYVVLRGLSSAAEVVGRKEDQMPRDDRFGRFGPRLAELEEQVLGGGGPIEDERLTLAEPGQPMQTFLLSVLPRMENRRLAGVLGVCTDVSQMAELERQVSQTSRLESIGQLAAGVAHEINTPVQYASDNLRFVTDAFGTILGGLRGFSALTEAADPQLKEKGGALVNELDLDFLAEEVPGALAQSQEGLERVAQIVRAMKEFSHPGGERTPTDLNQLVESTIQVSRNEWKYVSRLESSLDPELGEIPCFAGDIKQALLNILVNAAHAVDERRRQQDTDELGLITVTTARTDTDVVITVSDNGIGMDEEVRRRIFDPFFTTKTVGKGTGQGLSLAHSAVVTKHHGRIDVTSTPMQGTAFTIVLPIPVGTAGDSVAMEASGASVPVGDSGDSATASFSSEAIG